MKSFRGTPSLFTDTEPLKRQAHLEVKDITLKFGGVTALSKIDISVRNGELISLIGPNGSGKTSLLNCISGHYKPQKGKITLNGKEITHLSPHQSAVMGIGRTYQTFELFGEMTVLSNMLLARHVHLKYNVAEALLFSESVKAEEARQRQVVEEPHRFSGYADHPRRTGPQSSHGH